MSQSMPEDVLAGEVDDDDYIQGLGLMVTVPRWELVK